MTNELKTAIEAAKQGASVALRYFDKPLIVETKADNTPVTIADRKSEEAIISSILTSFPNAKFVAEETGGSKEEKEFWIIDPIDGTRSFSRGVPMWSVLIAHYKNGQVDLGVCYFPTLKTMLWAQKGQGAYIDSKKVAVSTISTVSESYINYGTFRYFLNKQGLFQLIEKSKGSRSYDISFGYYLVSCGKMEVSLDQYGYVWDLAAFKVITEEAGGTFTSIQGKPWTIHDRGCIATNGKVHNEVVSLVNTKF